MVKPSGKVIAKNGSGGNKPRAVAVPSRAGGYESVSIRPIDNGFLICRSTDKGYSETYSATKPKIEVPMAPKGKK